MMQAKRFWRTARAAGMSALFLAPMLARAQWQMQFSGTHVSLRGIHAVDGTIAWASGAHGTVVRTRDGGQHWLTCSTPPNAASLDFRSVWAWDANHAMVLSSGPGAQSKLYSTHDGCRTWRVVLTNPDEEGFWDGLQFEGSRFGVILGDPVRGSFTIFATFDGGVHWNRQVEPCLRTMDLQQGAFAASNQSLAILPLPAKSQDASANSHRIWFGTSGGWLYQFELAPVSLIGTSGDGCLHQRVLGQGSARNPAAGIFAIAFRDAENGVAAGGDYTKSRAADHTAAYTLDGKNWRPAKHMPGGYRSSVAWDASDGVWIAVGPTGSDTSKNGSNWQPLGNANWNAVSLPFAVGPRGRIGRLISWGELRANLAAPVALSPMHRNPNAKGQ
ncbi:MAG TPA: hypothetical protein VFN53_13410 [Acidobacteriaceae bacterium]|nr:hypothetical protein [Acidobacteriaceae bacterium]